MSAEVKNYDAQFREENAKRWPLKRMGEDEAAYGLANGLLMPFG